MSATYLYIIFSDEDCTNFVLHINIYTKQAYNTNIMYLCTYAYLYIAGTDNTSAYYNRYLHNNILIICNK